MDNETFEMVCKAAKNNLKNPLYYLFNTGLVLYFVGVAFFLYTFVFNFISYISSGQDFFTSLALSLFYSSTYFVGVVISSFVLVLAKIKLDKYKEN